MTKKKKIIILSCMIALLAVTAVFNFVFATENIDSNPVNSAVSEANFFSQYRTERLTNRNQEMLQLDSVIASAESGSAEFNDALAMKTALTKNTENEMLMENLIKSYGYEDVVVIIGLDSSNVNVITKSDEHSKQQLVQIYSLINEELAISPENVSIKHFS